MEERIRDGKQPEKTETDEQLERPATGSDQEDGSPATDAPPKSAGQGDISPSEQEDKTATDDADSAGGDEVDEREQEIERLKAKVNELQGRLEEVENRYLRAQADLENIRKRTRKEKEELLKYASQPVIETLLPALDNLERAITAGRDSRSADDGLAKGVEMVYRQILDLLAQEGLKPIRAVGEPFNPEFHEAVMQEESDEHASGTVIEELQKGYQLKDRVIRPSMVKVSK